MPGKMKTKTTAATHTANVSKRLPTRTKIMRRKSDSLPRWVKNKAIVNTMKTAANNRK